MDSAASRVSDEGISRLIIAALIYDQHNDGDSLTSGNWSSDARRLIIQWAAPSHKLHFSTPHIQAAQLIL